MTSRRPLIHSYSSNGRSGSQNGDSAPSPRMDSRNYLSSVRPENRSTFCSVMSQLTEETQPCFETTIKSKAVSETCNVKFSCVVTGYPVPELTWYKDDMELDRYCGLPKYEIFRNGKTHTLHIYNCTVDDAAIYQASARNSKGIVSCSGVLEVGSMSEYKIHQRFFAKLKQKAEAKRREIEESRRIEKEKVEHEQMVTQNFTLRNPGLLRRPELNSFHETDNETIEEPITEDTATQDEELNGFSEMRYDGDQENDSQQINLAVSQGEDKQQPALGINQTHVQQPIQIGDNKEMSDITLHSKEKISRNKIGLANGFEEVITNQLSHGPENGQDKHEGMSLAKMLVKSLNSETNEESQKTTIKPQESISIPSNIQDGSIVPQTHRETVKDTVSGEKYKDKEKKQESRQEMTDINKEKEKSRKREQELTNVREKEDSQNSVSEHRVIAASDSNMMALKDPDHQHKSALSLVFHSLKDIFFGKSKKETMEATKKGSDTSATKETPNISYEEHSDITSTQLQKEDIQPGSCGAVTDYPVPVERGVIKDQQTGDLSMNKQDVQPVLPISSNMTSNLNNRTDGLPHDDAEHRSPHGHNNVGSPVHKREPKGIFFGKSKKSAQTVDSSKHVSDKPTVKEIQVGNQEALSHIPQTQVQVQDSTQSKCDTLQKQQESVQKSQQHQPEDSNIDKSDIPVFLQVDTKTMTVNLDDRTPELTADLTQNIASSPHKDLDEVKWSTEEKELKNKDDMGSQLMTSSVVATEDRADADRDEDMVDLSHETARQECTAPMDQMTQAGKEMHAAKERDDITDFTEKPSARLAEPNMEHLKGTENSQEAQLSKLVNMVDEVSSISQKDAEMRTIAERDSSNQQEKMVTLECKSHPEKTGSSVVEEKVEERTAVKAPNDFSGEERKEKDMAVTPTLKPETDVGEVTERLSVNRQERDAHFQDKSNLQLSVDQGGSPLREKVDKSDSKQSKVLVPVSLSGVENDQGIVKKNGNPENTKEQTEGNKNLSLDPNTPNVALNLSGMKTKNTTETMGLESHGSTRQNKARPYAKAPSERPALESRDQMIILPDTRETVIKNVAKMRATPPTPDIKVTVADKVKPEEPTTIPKIDVVLTEPEKTTSQHEVAHMVKDNATQAENSLSDATRASSELIKDVGVGLEAKLQNVQTTVADDQSNNVMSDANKGNDSSSIPLISIACADDFTVSHEEEEAKTPTSTDQGHPDNALLPSISTTHIESHDQNSVKRGITADSLAVLLNKAVGNLDGISSTGLSLDKPAGAQEQNKNLMGTDFSFSLSAKDLPNIMQPEMNLSKDVKVEPETDRLQKEKPTMEKLSLTPPVGPTLPPLSPASLRRLMAKNNPNLESQNSASAVSGDGSESRRDNSEGSTPTSTLSCESSPKMKRRDSLTLIPSATPEELASGARRKIYLAKAKSEDEGSDSQSKRDMSPSQARRAAFLQLQSGQQTPPMEKRSPLLGRRKAMLDVPKPKEETTKEMESSSEEVKKAEKEKLDPFKAPQVIRKIRGETFSDALGHLKLWCQFFNVLSDSTITWFKDEVEIAKTTRSAGDESQVALAIVQASSGDCGVYGCTIKNEYGSDTTDYLLSSDILAEFFLRDDIEVGEEIEMTPLLFTKGLADPGHWGDKFFGRIMTEEVQLGEGCTHKTSRVKVIYGLDPVFESGTTCIAKVRNPIVYGGKEDNSLAERNIDVTKQDCKIQNTVREYCKVFSAEARVIDNFGFSLEVIPLYLMYRPANTIPYSTVESDLNGVYLKYCLLDSTGRLITRTNSEVEQKCCAFQHWIHQWTNGNLLVTQLEGVDTKLTNIRIATKTNRYQGLTDQGCPKILDDFVSQHQCNYYCGLLGLRPLTLGDSMQQAKVKSRSPMMARRVGLAGSLSPQLQKKGSNSPQAARKGNSSPKVAKKTSTDEENKPASKHKTVEVPKQVRMR